jgi:uncharacterized damage-inducible protein DinB
MRLTDLLKDEAAHSYAVTEALFRLVSEGDLGFKPSQGRNWMTLGQLVLHCTNACGTGIRGFVTGDWGLPQGKTFEDLPPDQALPPAEALPTVESLAKAFVLLAEDKALALECLDEAGEENLLSRQLAAPWGGPEMTLYQHLQHMIGHLEIHKSQLFYYLKLMGRDVNTSHLWGV